MKHYTIPETKPRSTSTPGTPEHKLYRKQLDRQKRGLRIPRLCTIPGCDFIAPFATSGMYCVHHRKTQIKKAAVRFHRKFAAENGMSYYTHMILLGAHK